MAELLNEVVETQSHDAVCRGVTFARSTGYRALGSCLRLSELSPSDFALWPVAHRRPDVVGLREKTGLSRSRREAAAPLTPDLLTRLIHSMFRQSPLLES